MLTYHLFWAPPVYTFRNQVGAQAGVGHTEQGKWHTCFSVFPLHPSSVVLVFFCLLYRLEEQGVILMTTLLLWGQYHRLLYHTIIEDLHSG